MMIDYMTLAVAKQMTGGGGTGGEDKPAVIAPIEITENGTYTAPSYLDGYSPVTVNVQAEEFTTQEKTVTPTTSAQTVKPDSGYDALSQVTVNAMPTAAQGTPSISVSNDGLITASVQQTAGYVTAGTKSATQQLPTQGAQTITPGKNVQTIASGKYLTGAQTIAGDDNLLAENIKSGVSVFGVEGTFEGEGESSDGGAPNGTNWTQSNLASGGFKGINYASGIWVATSAQSNGLYYSTDGKIWTQSNVTSGNFYDAYNANGIWVVSSFDNNGLLYSYSGKEWKNSNITSGAFGAVYNADGIWVATSIYGNQYLEENGFYYSIDGINWTQSNLTSGRANNFIKANGIWVASSNQGIYYSNDGKNWTPSNSPTYMIVVHFADGIFVAGSNNSQGIWYSTDGIEWKQSNVTSATVYSVWNANGMWLAGELKTGKTYYSIDGMTWTQNTFEFPPVSSSVVRMKNGNGIWISAYGNKGLYYSTNGTSWTQSNITTGTFLSPMNANGIWVAAARDSDSKGILYSSSWEPSV